MPIHNLGNGSGKFHSDTVPDWNGWQDRSEIHGGNGNDEIIVSGIGLVLTGDNGNDLLIARGSNELFGGRGADQLVTFGGGGNVLWGGPGTDSFSVNNHTHFYVTNEPELYNSTLSEGDNLFAAFDVIADYQPGELLRLDATENIGTIPLDSYRPGHQHPIVHVGEYGAVRGDLTDAQNFVVNATGGDMLFLYNPPDGNDEQFYGGAVVLLGITNPDLVLVG